jgi:hypothetical protein
MAFGMWKDLFRRSHGKEYTPEAQFAKQVRSVTAHAYDIARERAAKLRDHGNPNVDEVQIAQALLDHVMRGLLADTTQYVRMRGHAFSLLGGMFPQLGTPWDHERSRAPRQALVIDREPTATEIAMKREKAIAEFEKFQKTLAEKTGLAPGFIGAGK